MATMAQAQP